MVRILDKFVDLLRVSAKKVPFKLERGSAKLLLRRKKLKLVVDLFRH